MNTTQERNLGNMNGKEGPTTTADLLRDLRDESGLLIRQEIALARAEIKENLATAARSSLVLIFGIIVGGAGLVLLLVALSLGVAQLLVLADLSATAANFWGFLICALSFSVTGAIMGYLGWNKFSEVSLYPEKAIQQMRKDARHLKARI